MATKNCPTCSKQVPVACKKCHCGHVFFATRRGAPSTSTSVSGGKASVATASRGLESSKQEEFVDGDQPRRRTTRIQREKPKFYDALQFENQMRKESVDPNALDEIFSRSDPNPQVESDFLEDMDIDTLIKEPNPDKLFPKILLTVGTTSFDKLVNILCNEQTLFQFREWGTRHVRVQIGQSSEYAEGTDMICGIAFQFYPYKDTLAGDIQWADLIISHAGAGTVLDVLDAEKTLLVIPNTDLMDNHQQELAEYLHIEQYAHTATFDNYLAEMQKLEKSKMRQFPIKNPTAFGEYVEKVMNLDMDEVEKAKKKYKADMEGGEPDRDEEMKFAPIGNRKNRFTL